ncbi:MAG: hypothetical protein MK110_14795 [Fuerstiella sp.]|nr:hypothetical protein [Fuerstiella sp.]
MTGPRLSQIETLWADVRQNPPEDGPEMSVARVRLTERCRHLILQYLMACHRDRDAAQQVSLQFLRVDFSVVSAEKAVFATTLRL